MRFILFITLMLTCDMVGLAQYNSWVLQGPNGLIQVDATPWTEANISRDQAQEYIGYGFKDPNVVKEWQTQGLTAENMREWGSTHDAKSVKEWVKLGFNKREASSCVDNGYPVDKVKELIAAGFKPEDSKAICNMNEKTRTEWVAQKFTLKQLSQWSRGFNLEEAVKWRNAGFTYSEAEKYKSFELQVALKIKRRCPGGIKSIDALYSSNPYDVAGKCYEFVGETQQILSRSTALFNQSGRSFYINFEKASAPAMYFRGVVKGVGVYEYTTTIGALKKVPHLTSVYQRE